MRGVTLEMIGVTLVIVVHAAEVSDNLQGKIHQKFIRFWKFMTKN